MKDELKRQAIEEIIKKTYEDMGIAILKIEPVNVCSFRCDIIDGNGPRSVLVTLFMTMSSINANQW